MNCEQSEIIYDDEYVLSKIEENRILKNTKIIQELKQIAVSISSFILSNVLPPS